jgi:hypothetical protein
MIYGPVEAGVLRATPRPDTSGDTVAVGTPWLVRDGGADTPGPGLRVVSPACKRVRLEWRAQPERVPRG